METTMRQHRAPVGSRAAVIAMLLALGSGVWPSEAQRPDPRGAIFVARGCSQCHGVWALGVKAKSDVGPDLTFAYIDVVNRYGESLEAFLNRPVGIMRLMLAEHVHLSAADRDTIAHILGKVYLEHRAQLGDETLPIAQKEK
jgi:hypothetical protein